MLTQIHFLLSYTCTYECDHCFVYSSPNAQGTFTINKLIHVFNEISKIKTIDTVYFEGGEPFLYYPLMLEGIRIAYSRGLKSGIVTNAYWANSLEDAKIWLKPLINLGITNLSVSDDEFHRGEETANRAEYVITAAKELELPVATIRIEKPKFTKRAQNSARKGESVSGGGVKFKGRAVETMSNNLPKRDAKELTECPYEDFETPKRVHIDPFGYVHICQGISMGNIWEIPLSKLVESYTVESHPICEPLIDGGPYRLAEKHRIPIDAGYVDECHLCFNTRKMMINRFPQYLAPLQVYGL